MERPSVLRGGMNVVPSVTPGFHCWTFWQRQSRCSSGAGLGPNLRAPGAAVGDSRRRAKESLSGRDLRGEGGERRCLGTFELLSCLAAFGRPIIRPNGPIAGALRSFHALALPPPDRLGRSIEREANVLDQELQVHRIAGRHFEIKVLVERPSLLIHGMNEQ